MKYAKGFKALKKQAVKLPWKKHAKGFVKESLSQGGAGLLSGFIVHTIGDDDNGKKKNR